MKRLKFLPSILMLVLCIGVLCMGIYAATPNSNQISGSITINPANAEVDIYAWTEDYEGNATSTVQEQLGVRSGNKKFEFNSGLTLNQSSANDLDDVKRSVIKIRVVNKSNKELGIFFSKDEITNNAIVSDVFLGEDLTTEVGVEADMYTHINKQNNENTTDEATITLAFKSIGWIESEEDVTVNFDYYINVEEYKANLTEETFDADDVAAIAESQRTFLKLSSAYGTTTRESVTDTTGFKDLISPEGITVIIPNTVTTISESAFTGCTSLKRIGLPNTLTTIGSFSGCTNLEEIVLPSGVTSIAHTAFTNCTSLTRLTLSSGSFTLSGTGAAFETCTLLDLNEYRGGSYIGSYTNPFMVLVSVNTTSSSVKVSESVSSLYPSALSGYIGDLVHTQTDGETYEFTNGTLTISSFPASGTPAWESLVGGVQTVVFEDTVTAVPDFAFVEAYDTAVEGAYSYTDNSTGEGITRYYVPKANITSVTFGANTTEIGVCAFASMDIQELEIPASVTKIRDHAFYSCSEIEELTFEPNSELTLIDNSAFSGCSSIKSVVIPASVTKIGEAAFQKNYALTSVTFEENSQLIEIEGQAFRNTAIKTFDMPNTVTTVGKNTFRECTKLQSIKLSNTLQRLENQTFFECGALTSITIPASVTYIGKQVFLCTYSYNQASLKETASTLQTVVFEEGSKLEHIDQQAFDGTKHLQSINLEACSKLETISNNAFYDTKSLTSITFPASIKTIGSQAFATNTATGEVPSLQEVKFLTKEVGGDQLCMLETIDANAFSSLSKLNNIDLTYCSRLTTIGNAAFRNCSSLTEIFIPASVTTIGTGTSTVFYETRLTKVVVGSVQNWFKISFANNDYANPLFTAKKMYTRGAYNQATGKYNDVEVTSIDLSQTNITAISAKALYGCTSIQSISLPASLETIGDNAFYGCSALTTVTMQTGLKTIGNNAFFGCTVLTNVSLPEGLESIGNSAFVSCKALISITIPASVTRVGYNVFTSSNLTELTFADETNETWTLTNKDTGATMTKTINKVAGLADGTTKTNLLKANAQLFRSNSACSWAKNVA